MRGCAFDGLRRGSLGAVSGLRGFEDARMRGITGTVAGQSSEPRSLDSSAWAVRAEESHGGAA